MIRNAFTGEPKSVPKTAVQQESDFTAEGSPPPGRISGTEVPETKKPAQPTPLPEQHPADGGAMSMRASNGDARNGSAPSAPTADWLYPPGQDAHPRSSTSGLLMSGVTIEDWDCLLDAVTMRLRLVVADTPTQLRQGDGSALQASVLECADALDRLHDMLRTALADAQRTGVNPPSSADGRGDRGAPERP